MANTQPATTLFPILQHHPAPLARRAAEAPLADTGHETEYRALEARSLLNKTTSRRGLSLAYSINPYRGCEFACRYCYARYTHEFLAPNPTAVAPARDLRHPDAFERIIFLKQNAAWLLTQELRKIDPTQEIALGTATDPYQPIERRARITRSLLEVFARQRGLRLGIVTKSPLVTRDLDLLRAIAERNTLVVHLTITTVDAPLARFLEPRAPRPDLRLGAVARLRTAGIRTGILCSPLLPGLTDNAASINAVAHAARLADASFLAGEPLFLKPCSRPTYLAFLRDHFPHLVGPTSTRFARADFADRPYREHARALVAEACQRHGIPPRSTDALLTRDVGFDAPTGSRKPPQPAHVPAQLRIFA